MHRQVFNFLAYGRRACPRIRPWARKIRSSFHPIRNQRSLGLTIIELLVVIAMIGTLAAIGTPLYATSLDKARIAKAIADIRTVEREIYLFHLFNGRFPKNLTEVERGNLLDPWTNPYQYLEINCDWTGGKCKPPKGHRKDQFFKPLNKDFDLYSNGKDGLTKEKLDSKEGSDDIVRAVNGGFVGLASEF